MLTKERLKHKLIKVDEYIDRLFQIYMLSWSWNDEWDEILDIIHNQNLLEQNSLIGSIEIKINTQA